MIVLFLVACDSCSGDSFFQTFVRYGDERYEKRDMQMRVKERFSELRNMDDRVPWHVVNAAQTVEKVQADILAIVEDTVLQVYNDKPLYKLWTDGNYPLQKKQQD